MRTLTLHNLLMKCNSQEFKMNHGKYMAAWVLTLTQSVALSYNLVQAFSLAIGKKTQEEKTQNSKKKLKLKTENFGII